MESLIYLLRHGAIDKPAPHAFIGQTDLPLSDTGIRQAQELAEQLQDIPFTQVFSSPLQRALQTAALVGGVAAAKITPVADFQEINLGAWEGLSVAEVEKLFPGEYEQRGRDLENFRPAGGESFADLATRCYPALLTLAQRYPGPLLIVAHAGVNRVLLSRLQHKPLAQLLAIAQDYCALNILRRSSGPIQVAAINQKHGKESR